MKTIFAFIAVCLTNAIYAQYKGGRGDGFGIINTASQNAVVNIYNGGSNNGYYLASSGTYNQLSNIYNGGTNDGFMSVASGTLHLLNNIYNGGSDDGVAFFSSTLLNSYENIYNGGKADGFASVIIISENQPNNIYNGGMGDGFSAETFPVANGLAGIYSGGKNDGFATITVTNQNPLGGALSVKLLQFSGRWQQQDILLYWKTAQETNSSHFELERSVNNGNSFVKIGTVQAGGNTSVESKYEYTDFNTNVGDIFYYRLKMVDADGRFTYSAVIRFTKLAKEVSYTIYPNPGNGWFNINIAGISNLSGYQYRVFDNRGGLIATGNITSLNTQFDISRFSAGTYYVQIIAQNKILNTYKIILQH